MRNFSDKEFLKEYQYIILVQCSYFIIILKITRKFVDVIFLKYNYRKATKHILFGNSVKICNLFRRSGLHVRLLIRMT
jgi:hypothetical protein